ncbi:MAG: trimeric intracellular cation channel family protein [Thauera sp.]|uniref:trimeric intracellular cation channel family protein n=1 Tax=Thauera sp. JM12B12 TaxID=3142262 RepID=UPI0029C1F0BD|nr:trimeric intracellular cation channel family protein [Thauera sp.]
MKFQTILLVIEVGGTLAFAMSGLLEAIRKRMDIVGVFSVAFVSAFGGGTVRDVLLDRRPLFWVQNQEYVWLVIALVVTAPLWVKTFRHRLTENAMEFADACGLGLFAISGASIASAAGMPPLVAVLMGAITAVFGGVSRDVLCNQIPKVYYDHRPYTLCAVVGCAVFLGANAIGVAQQLSMVVGICTATGLRVLAVIFGWKLPAWPLRKG